MGKRKSKGNVKGVKVVIDVREVDLNLFDCKAPYCPQQYSKAPLS